MRCGAGRGGVSVPVWGSGVAAGAHTQGSASEAAAAKGTRGGGDSADANSGRDSTLTENGNASTVLHPNINEERDTTYSYLF